jgi:acetyl esterase/lipase
VALLLGCKGAFFQAVNLGADRDGLTVVEDVSFDPEHQLAMDVYRPVGDATLPTLVFFYGGSWKSGRREWYRWAGQMLARQGFVVAVPDYRHWPPVRVEGFLQDAARAVAYVHAHAAEWHGDPDRLFLVGHSAGSYIASMLAVEPRWLEVNGMKPTQITAVVGLAGPYDFVPIHDEDFIAMFGATLEEQQRLEPMSNIGHSSPPMLLLHGNADDLVEPTNATAMAAAMAAKGRSAKVIMYPDLGHITLLLNMREKESKVRDDVVAFLRAHGARPPPK